MLSELEQKGELPRELKVLAQLIQIGEGMRFVALEGEPVAELGWIIHHAFDSGVTCPLGYSNGAGMYLPCDRMLPEGGYEVESHAEYGLPSRLAHGIDENLNQIIERCKDDLSREQSVRMNVH